MNSQHQFKLTIKKAGQSDRPLEFSGLETVIGRDPTSDCVVDFSAVSRQHAKIRRVGEGYTIEDLGSSNGTFLNERRLSQPTTLKAGDVIGIGRAVTLVFDPEPAIRQPTPTERPSVPPSGPSSTPQLSVAIAGYQPQLHDLTQQSVSLGRDQTNDIAIDSEIVSRQHAHLERANGGYLLVVNPNASNPVFINGVRVTQPQRLQHENKLRIGGRDPGTMVTMTFISPTEAGAPEAMEIRLDQQDLLRLGRDPSNDVFLDAPQISHFHAQVEQANGAYRLIDLQSTNGTFVNDSPITEPATLSMGDSIRIGPYRFVVGEQVLTQHDDSSSVRLEAIRLHKWVKKDLNILQDISLVIQPREFVVVVGQSGGGKSTLVDALAGYRPATHGQVTVNETDVYKSFDSIRNLIGFVPQKDIIHTELTVYEALDYSGRLRMPPDTSKAERHARVMEVLEDLDLADRKDVLIGSLSGGQQKRVSIGVELLTKPGLFFLDEPTSGLDPGTETALMHLMRRLADRGRTIVLITHATKNVLLADKVVFLARGGFLTWFGPPEEALIYFDPFRSERERLAGPIEFDQIYALLEDASKGTPQQWAARYQEDAAYREYIVNPLHGKSKAEAPERPNIKAATRRNTSSLRQLMILSSRNIKILIRDRSSLALMLAAAPLIGLLDFVLSSVLGPDLFGFNDGDVTDIVITLFLLVVYGVLVGALSQMREFVKEGEIYRRERLVSLKIFPYVLSKVWVAALFALYQTAAYTIIRYLAFDMPGGVTEVILIYVTLGLATMTGMMLGLFASAISPNANTAPLFVILLILPQIVLGGALVQLPDYVTAPIPTRWAFQAIMGITGVGSDIAADVCWTLSEELRMAMTIEDKLSNNCNCMGTNALRESSCNTPGVGGFYVAAIDESPPADPPPPPERPENPVIPEPPEQPADESDQVAVAEYLTALQEYQVLVEGIRSDSEAAFTEYEAELSLYQAQVVAHQQELVEWRIARQSAVLPAEGMIALIVEDYSWTFVDKDSPERYFRFVATAWAAQIAIILTLLVVILIVQKQKDIH